MDWVTGQSYSPKRDGSMYSQPCVRTGRHVVTVRAWPPEIVSAERYLRAAGGPVDFWEEGLVERWSSRSALELVTREPEDHKRENFRT